MSQTYYIYHHADFDGTFSAFLMRRFLRHHGISAEFGEALNYDPQSGAGWENYSFKEPFILLDFRWHDRASGFIDHHANHCPTGSVADLKWYRYNPQAPSAAQLIFEMINEAGISLGNIAPMVHAANLVDTAAYAINGLTPEDVVLLKNKAIQIAKVIEDNNDVIPRILSDLAAKNIWDKIECRVFGRWIERIAGKDYVKERVKKLRQEILQHIELFRTLSEEQNGVVWYDMTSLPYNRFLPAMIYKDSYLWVGVCFHENKYSLKMNLNPWGDVLQAKKFQHQVDLGKIAQQLGGGGHPQVGTVYVASYEEAKEKFNQAKEMITPFLDS